MPEQWEVMGDNNAPQMVVDTDDSVKPRTALYWLIGSGLAFAGFYQLIKATKPEEGNPTVLQLFFVFSESLTYCFVGSSCVTLQQFIS